MSRRHLQIAACFCMLLAVFPAFAQSPKPAAAPAETSRDIPADILKSCPTSGAQLRDRTHFSQVFGEQRHYRIFLPANYNAVATRYPVIYYFHGSSDRYTLEDYDQGHDTVPKICAFVAAHPVIVVAVDGYMAAHYTGFYGGSPYDVRLPGGDIDFGNYFLELVHSIDTTYRTRPSRRYRAVSGLSMGGFMSLYLSARYPDIIGSCSAFNPGPEFYVGTKDRRSLWRPKDFVSSFEHTPVRLVRASGDYISQYTEETRAAFAAAPAVPFEFRQDEYHRHWATSIGETSDFHLRAFADAALDTRPTQWNYAGAENSFDVWGYHVQANIVGPAIIYLQQVSRSGMLLETRRWAPDGPPAACGSLNITTAPLYAPHTAYRVLDLSLQSRVSTAQDVTTDAQGRLHLQSDCTGHALGIAGPGIGIPSLQLLPVTEKDFLRVLPDHPVSMPIRIWNPGAAPRKNLRVELTSQYPTVHLLHDSAKAKELAVGEAIDLAPKLSAQFVSGDGDFQRARLSVSIRADDLPPTQTYFDVLVAPANLSPPAEIEILDGRTKTFLIFRQGVHGGGASELRTVTEGKGNGNGVLEPGEQATVWLRLPQGLDPFDKGNWCRAKIYSESPWLTEVADLQEDKRQEWTSAQNRTSVVELSPDTPKGTSVSAILDCEAYSFAFAPDVRYGKQPLYQPFQRHRHYLFAWKWQGVETPSTQH